MTDHLPPERPLSDEARDRIRARLHDHAVAETGAHRRGWVLPVAAAVVLVIGISTGVGVLAGHQHGSGSPAPYLGGSTSAGTTKTPAPDAAKAKARLKKLEAKSKDRHKKVLTKLKAGEAKLRAETRGLLDPNGPLVPCPKALAETDIADPASYAEVGHLDHADGTTAVYANQSHWLVCDQWAVGWKTTTILDLVPTTARLGPDLFGISMNFQKGDQGMEAEYVAGGRLPQGVTAISYRFSDGHVEPATIGDGIWAMVYLPQSGPYAGNGAVTNGGADVTVTMADGSTQHYPLTYPDNFCAQLNHGC